MNSYMNITVRVLTKQAQAMLVNLERQLTTTSRVADSASFGAGAASRAARGFKTFGNSLQWAGYQLMHAFTIPLLAAGGAAVKYELANEKAFAGIQKVYGDTALKLSIGTKGMQRELNALRGEFEALSDVYGKSQTDVLNIAEAWAAAGVSGKALGTAVENTLKTMVIGDLDAVKSTKALISIQAQFGVSSAGLTKILQALNTTENITGATMGDLIDGFERSAGVAVAAGVDYKHLAAMIAALVPSAGSASRAGNALKTIFTNLLVPTTKATEALKEMGINIDDQTWKSLTATQRLELLSQKFKKLDGNQKVAASNYIAGKYQISRFDQAMADLGKSFDAHNKLIKNNDAALGYYGKTLSATRVDANNAKIAQQELNTVLQSNPQKLSQVWTILKNEAADAVRGLIPFIIQFVTILAGMVHWFSNLNPVIQRWVAIFTIGLALLGPILLYFAAISKLIHFVGVTVSKVGGAVKWFFGLFAKGVAGGATAEFSAIVAAEEEVTAAAKIATAALQTQIGVMAEKASMGGMMGESIVAAEGFVGAAADSATVQLGIQLGMLRAIELQAVETARVQIAAQAGVARAALASAGATGAAGAATGRRAIGGAAGTAGAAAAGERAANGKLYAQTRAATQQTEGIFKRSLGKITGMFSGAFSRIGSLIGVGTAGAAAEGAGGLGAFGAAAGAAAIPVGVIVAAVVALIAIFLIFRHQITSLAKEFWGVMKDFAGWAWQGMKSIGDAFMSAVRFIGNALAQLPKIVVSIFKSVVNIIGEAAKQVYELFSYINPFAHHSPSLVEQVDKGLDFIARKFAGLPGGISGSINRAYHDISSFGKAIRGLIKTQDDLKRAADIKLLGKYAPGAIGEYRRLAVDLRVLTAEYEKLGAAMARQQKIVDAYQAATDRLNEKLDREQAKLEALQKVQSRYSDLLDAAKSKLDQFANAPIQGMKAYTDAIFENDQAQKKLQLQMLKMEDAVGPIDKVQSKLAGLAGDIEKLRGEQTDLRQAGAGSDILSAYDAQIAALEGQQTSINDTVDQYKKLQDELDALKHKADELDLEKSLKFDPLTKQIDDMVNATKEIPFDDIVAGIRKWQAEVDKNQKAYDKATAAVNKQQGAVDKATAARDAMQKRLDAEQKTLDRLQNAYQKVGDAMQAITDKIGSMTDAANELANAAEKAKDSTSILGSGGNLKASSGKDVLGRIGGLGDQTDQIKKDTEAQLKKLEDLFNRMDLFGGLKDKFKSIGRWIKKWIWDEPAKWGDWITAHTKELGKKLWGWAGDGLHWIVDGLSKGWDAVVGFVSDLPGKVWGWLGDSASWIADGIGKAWSAIADFFSKLPGRILSFLSNAPSMLLEAGKQIIYGLGYGLGFALGAITRVLWTLLKLIIRFFENAPHWLAVAGKWIIHGLVSGIKIGAKAVGTFFSNLPGWIGRFFANAGRWLWNAGKWTLSGLKDGIVEGAKAVGTFFVNLPGWIGRFFSNAATWLWNTGKTILTGLFNGINSIGPMLETFFTNLPGWIGGFFKDAGTWLWHVGGNILHGLWNGFTSVLSTIWDGISTFIGGFIDGFKKALGIKSPSTVFMSIGKNIMRGLWHGITSMVQMVLDFFINLPGRIIRGIGNVASLLYGKGKDILGSWSGYGGLFGGLHRVWDSISTWFGNLPGKFVGFFGKALTWLYNAGKDIGQGLINGIQKIMGAVSSALFKPAVTVVIHVVNAFIRAIDAVISGVDKVSDLLHLGFHIDQIPTLDVPKLARGGRIPYGEVGQGFKTMGPRAIVGEGDPAHPEYVIPTDPRHRGRARDLWRALGKDIRMFAGGGQLPHEPGSGSSGNGPTAPRTTNFPRGNIGEATVNADIRKSQAYNSQLVEKSKSTMEQLGDIIKTIGGILVRSAVKTAFWPVKEGMDAAVNVMPIDFLKKMGHKWIESIWHKIDGIARNKEQGIDPDPVKRFAPVAAEMISRLHFPGDQSEGNTKRALRDAANLVPHVLRRLNQESGGDPNAINNTDSNALKGTPSKGIMQVIDPTFNSYKNGRIAPDNIWDPRANMYAGLNYAQHQYGSIQAAMDKAGGYAMGGVLPAFADGGIANRPTAGVFGEAGREVLAPLDPLWNRLSRIENNVSANNEKLSAKNGGATELHFHGDLNFPNITSGDDADALIRNLKRAAGGK